NRTFPRSKDATNYKRKLEHDEMLGVVIDPQRTTMSLEVYAKQWSTARRKADGSPLAPRTRELYRALLDSHIIPKLGPSKLGTIRPEQIRRWYGQVAESATPLQAAKAYRLLRTIFATAVADDRLGMNPCNLRGAGQERSAERPLVDAESLMALGDAIDPRYKALVLLAVFGGLGRGELLGLRRGDIDVLHRTVEVERQAIQMNSGERLVSAPKTVAGIRKVHVPSLVADVLADHLANFVPPEAEVQ